MEIRVKKVLDDLNEADIKLPSVMHKDDACFDFYAPEKTVIQPHEKAYRVRTGLALEVPEGYHLELFIRSGCAKKRNLRLSNSTGIVDSGYRGEIIAMFDNIGDTPEVIEKGERIVQGLIQKNEPVTWKEVDQLSQTGRGDGGFGSTGRF